MKDTIILTTLAALSLLMSCSMEPCLADSMQADLETCRSCSDSARHGKTARHLGSPADHVEICPSAADSKDHYAVRPGT